MQLFSVYEYAQFSYDVERQCMDWIKTAISDLMYYRLQSFTP